MNIIRSTDGQRVQVLGDAVTIKIPSAASPFGQAIVTVDVPPGSGTPCVTHATEEEVYFVLDGELLMHAPGQEVRLAPGDMVHLPPRTPHGYRNPGERPARFLAWTVGGPMDQFFLKMADRVTALPRDFEAMRALMDEHGVARVR
jgi:quercetin dioxygenase-like cupin family protein